MKRYLFLTAVFGVVLTFQNCSPQQLQTLDEGALAQNDIIQPNSGQLPGDSSQVEKIEIGNLDRGVRFVEASIQVVDSRLQSRFIIDLDAARISIVNGTSQVISSTCLPSSLKTEIEGVLDAAKLCRVQATDQICSLALQKPYAHLLYRDNPAEAVSLGAGINGCGHEAIAFCDDRDAELKALITEAKVEFQSYSCE